MNKFKNLLQKLITIDNIIVILAIFIIPLLNLKTMYTFTIMVVLTIVPIINTSFKILKH